MGLLNFLFGGTKPDPVKVVNRVVYKPVKNKWTATSSTYQGRDKKDQQKFILDIGITWQNYIDNKGEFRSIDLTPELSDDPRFDYMIARAPYKLYMGLNGSRRIYPDRHDPERWIEFPASGFLAGRDFNMEEKTLRFTSQKMDIEIGWGNSRVSFDTIINAPVEFNKIEFDYTSNGLTIEQIKQFIGKPQAYERAFENVFRREGRDIDVVVDEHLIELSFDLTDMKFPIVIDPTLDLQVGADADDAALVSGAFVDNTNTIDIGVISGGVNDGYWRFTGVTVPGDATVTASTLIHNAGFSDSGTVVRSNVSAEDVDNGAQVTSASEWTTAVAQLTTASTVWDNIPAWTDDEEGPDTTSPDISAVIQEIIDRASWASGNAINIFQLNDSSDNNAVRGVTSHNNTPGEASKLQIVYTEAAAGGIPRSIYDSQLPIEEE